MNRLIVLGLAATFGAANVVIRTVQGNPVELQSSSPGTVQTGHLNISGTATVGQLKSQNTVFGQSTAPTGVAYGGFFTAASNQARGFYGFASATSGLTYGGFFQNASSQGRAVYGLATGTTADNYGGYFQAAGTSARGLLGVASAATGTTYGVYGRAISPTGFGVYSQGNMAASGVISGNGSGLTSVNAALLGGQSASAFLTAIPVPLNVTGTGAHIIRATNTGGGGSVAVLGLATNSNGGSGGRFETNSEDGHGLLGFANSIQGNTAGIYGQSASFEGYGVFGKATHSVGETYGVRGESSSTSGYGVFGLGIGSSGRTVGTAGRTDSPSGYGVYGFATATSGVTGGVRGDSESVNGRGVTGMANAVSAASGIGVYGESKSVFGIGVHAIASNTSSGHSFGVLGENEGSQGTAVQGIASHGDGNTYGVKGQSNSENGYGLFSSGRTGATGTKSFRIDHPFDPENKYLLHYAAESPKPQNFYVGNVVTDAQGYAWVTLPDYFSEINANFKYQLTVISEDFVQAVVSKKINANRFQVRTSAANTEVSWRVDADRNDLYVRNRPTKDVIDKEGREKGTYQHPEFYDLGPERGMGYDPARDKVSTKSPPAQQSSRSQNKR